MASNIERLTVKDTFTNWRDKLNALIDVAMLAPMADENGIMNIDVTHCNAREVRFNVPVVLGSDVQANQINCTGSFTSSITATTIQETAEAGLKLTGTEGYIPWVAGQTQNGTASIWTSTYDNSVHFSFVDVNGELVNTFQWNPETNLITAQIENAGVADVAKQAEKLQLTDLSEDALPGSYPMIFGSVEDGAASGAWDNDFTYDPRNGILTVPTVKGNLDGNAKTSTSTGKLTTPVKISLGTDASGYVMFDGSVDVTIPCRLAATGVIAGLYGPSGNVFVPRTNRRFTVPSFRVDDKGRITQAFTRTVEFPFPEVDVDTELDASSSNPIQNKAVSEKFNQIDTILETTATTEVATATSAGLMSAADKLKLNGLTQNPRIDSISVHNHDAVTDEVTSIDSKSLSTSKATQLTVNAKGGLTGEVSIVDGMDHSEISLDLGVQLTSIAGDGLVEVDGKLVPRTYSGPTSTTPGTAGMVPSATKAQESLFLNGAGQWANPIGTTYDPATQSSAGLMSAADKTKLDGIRAGATAVSVTRNLTSGTKVATITINGTATDLYAEKNTDTTYTTMVGATSSAAGKAGLVPAPAKGAQTKYLRGDATWQAGYDATTIDSKLAAKADTASPALTGTPTAPTAAAGANTNQIANTAFVTNAISNVIGASCPAGLDTLKELAASIGNNTNFKKYVDDGLTGKLSTTSSGYVKTMAISGRTITVTRGDNTTFTLTTQDNNTTYTNFVKSGSTAAAGLVPKPPTTAGSTKYLCENGTWTVPAMNADVNVKNTLNKTAKAYVTGTTTASTNTGGLVFDTGVFLDTTAGMITATTFKGALSGNATSATKLQTKRTINGVGFDGTGNITVADSTKLPLTGGTLTGNLVIKKAGPALFLQNTDVNKGSKPSAAKYWSFPFTDKNGNAGANRLGLVETSLATTGNVVTAIRAYRNTSGATTNAALSITLEQGGTSYANCPTPPAGDSSTKIATTAWVNTKVNGANTGMVPSGSWSGRSWNTWYTETKNGFVWVRFNVQPSEKRVYFSYNNGNGQVDRQICHSYGGDSSNQALVVPIKKGLKWKCYGTVSSNNLWFLPAQ